MTETTGADVAVRLAEPADLPDITRIYNVGIEGRSATFDADLRTERQIRDQLARASILHPAVVATADGVVVGWAFLRPYSDRAVYWASRRSPFSSTRAGGAAGSAAPSCAG